VRSSLGDESAVHFRKVLPDALRLFRHVVVLTHIPPFREACWHEGAISNDNWLPHCTCKAAGDAIAEAMTDRTLGMWASKKRFRFAIKVR
jgi:3',5'-cyclic-AMP phosphodiesterase